ncbi:MAG TPA: hypothetical protein VH916_10310 [Dehalococcoidia bacterium]|jgi:uncharacterized membrane protein YeaQ/YmgE (transglycosylase-associated protein family)
MAANAFFFALELLLWLCLGLAGWLAVTLRMRPRASLAALLAALVAAPICGALPGLLGWHSLPGLLCGLVLAAVGGTLAAWQTMKRLPVPVTPSGDAGRPA